jgi:hypothetical protein
MPISRKNSCRKLYTIKGIKEDIQDPTVALDEVKLTKWQIKVQAGQVRRAEREQRILIKEEKAEQAEQLRQKIEKKLVAEKLKALQEKGIPRFVAGVAQNVDGGPVEPWDLNEPVVFDQAVYDGLSKHGKKNYLKCCQIARGEIVPRQKLTASDIADKLSAKSVYIEKCPRCGYENTFPKNPAPDQVLRCSNCGLSSIK